MTNRNTNARFELAPQVEIERSTFDRSSNVKTSFDVGQLVPFYVDEVLPGDTFEISTAKVTRLQTLITPVMDNLYLDTYYFFVPNRLVWEHWREFMGENTLSYWTPTVEYTIPQIATPTDGWNVGTTADYFGIPTGIPATIMPSVNALPFRAYALIWNEWFRDENVQTPVLINKGDSTVQGVNAGSYVADGALGMVLNANKYHDYFTSCLPAPQKGPDVLLPLGDKAPVVPYGEYVPTESLQEISSTGFQPLRWLNIVKDSAGDPKTITQDMYDKGTLLYNGIYPVDNDISYGGDTLGARTKIYSLLANQGSPSQDYGYFFPANLYANLQQTTGATINQLRQAFAIQRLYEKDARGGTRYIELIKAHFGVESPDARLQRPEYLGGNRVAFNIEQAMQTSSTDATSPLGTLAGWSQTVENSTDVYKSFTEHGYIIGLCCARYDHSYQQGINRMWSRQDRFDFYWPALAHLGEQAVFTKEIYAGVSDYDDVFGYQEAWAEYRYKPDTITGEMRSQYAQSLDIWHFADYYNSEPNLSAQWMFEDKSNIDRTLAIPSTTSNQIFGDIQVSCKVTRPMPLYSIPGLIDHF